VHVCLVLDNHFTVQMGGAEYQAHLLAEELSHRAGVRVTYLAAVIPGAHQSYALSYELRQFGGQSALKQRAPFLRSAALWRALHDLHPDAIYQRMKQSYTAVCALYAHRRNIPMLFHAASDPDVDGRLVRKRLSANAPFDLLEAWIGNWGVRHASGIVVQTDSQSQLLTDNFDRRPDALIRNCQPLPDALPVKTSGPLRVLWVGGIKDVKRPELFVELARAFSTREDIEFWMVGRPPSHRRFGPLMAAIKASSNIRFFGELPQEEVNALMNEAHVLVNTSAFEGSPNTFIQAWARGVVVTSLAIDVDGGLETEGIGYCSGTLPRLVGTIESLSTADDLRQETARRGFAYVRRRHSMANAATLGDLLLDMRRDRAG